MTLYFVYIQGIAYIIIHTNVKYSECMHASAHLVDVRLVLQCSQDLYDMQETNEDTCSADLHPYTL